MRHRSTQRARERLHSFAREPQAGYFTAKQAAKLGYGYPHLSYHVKAGNLERTGHGVYRLALAAVSEHDDLVRLSLWSRDRADQPQAVISHASALAVHGLSNLLPGSIHLTVPRGFQKKAPRACKLHRGELERDEIEQRAGFRVTSVARTLIDVAQAPEIAQSDLDAALSAALERGLVRRRVLSDAAKRAPTLKRLQRALKAAQDS